MTTPIVWARTRFRRWRTTSRLDRSLVRKQRDGKVVFIEKVLGGFVEDEWQARPSLATSVMLSKTVQKIVVD